MQPTYLAALTDARSLTSSPALSVAEKIGAVAFVAVLTAIAAQVSIPLPFTPVPFTMQPMIVLLGGAALGARLGASSQALYLLLGIAGLPVFAASATLPPGAARLFGPTGGYLMSYPFAALITGYLGARGFDRRYLTSVAAMLAGLVVIFAGRVLWLAMLVGPRAALVTGFYPFIVADLAKVLAAAGIMPGMWRLLGR